MAKVAKKKSKKVAPKKALAQAGAKKAGVKKVSARKSASSKRPSPKKAVAKRTAKKSVARKPASPKKAPAKKAVAKQLAKKPATKAVAKKAAPAKAAPARKRAPVPTAPHRGHAGRGRPDGGHAFLPDADEKRGRRVKDDLAEELGEDFVSAATSGEATDDAHDEPSTEEEGGPFITTSAESQYASGTDASNPEDAEPEPFPRTRGGR